MTWRIGSIVGLTAAALCAPLLASHRTEGRSAPFAPPGSGHLLGTDALGRDVLAELLLRAPATFTVPAVAALTLAVVGSLAGILLGLGPALVRRTMMRLGDVVVIVPPLVITLVIVVGVGATPISIVVAVIVAGVVMFTRVMSDATLQLARAGHVEAAFGFGDPGLRVAVTEVLPRLGQIVLAETTLRFLGAIQLVAALSFLGFAGSLGDSWARALRENLLGFSLNPWAALAPGVALVACVATVAILAESSPRGSAGRR